MGRTSWLMFMINPRKKSSASVHLTTFHQLWHTVFLRELEFLLWNWSSCCMISCETEHLYWPGVHSCHRGWHTSAKSSCLRGGWWQEIWPLGSFASPLQCADNPSRKKKVKNNWGHTSQTHHSFVPPFNARSLIVKRQSMNTCEKGILENLWGHCWCWRSPPREGRSRVNKPSFDFSLYY